MAHKISGSYSNILKNIVDDTVEYESSNFNVNNKFIITQELCDFETNIDLSNNNILNVNTISPCTQINCGNLTLTGHTINDTSGVNMLINNVQKINNKLLPSGDFFGTTDLLTLSQIPNGLITTNKITSINNNTILGNNSGALSPPIALTTDQVKTMLSITNQTITLSGDITGTGSTDISTAITAGSISLGKMATLAANSIIGNNTGVAATPKALNVTEIRTMLNITNVDNVSLNSWTGSANITTVGNNIISLANMSTLAANSIIGNNTGVAATPKALNVSEIRTLLNITNVENTTLSTFTGTTYIQTIGSLTTLNAAGISFSNRILTTGYANQDISINPTGNLNIGANINMNTKNISSLGTINSLSLPSSNIVGLTDVQTLTNKTINASQLVDGSISSSKYADFSISLTKMQNLPTLTFVGNSSNLYASTPEAMNITTVKNLLGLTGTNSGDQTITLSGDVTGQGTAGITATISNNAITSAKIATGALTLAKMEPIPVMTFMGNSSNLSALFPEAMNITTVKTLLGITNVNNVSINSWTGSSNLTVLGTLNNLNVGFLNMSLSTLTATGSNASVNISATGTGIINVLSTLRLSNGITSTGTLTITANGGASPVEIWGPLDMKTNSISNVNEFTCSGSMSNGGTYSNFVTSRTTNSNLTLSANGTGIVATGNSSFWVNSTVTNIDSVVAINGPTVTNSRYVGCYQNGTYKLSFGLSASSHFFIYDGVNSRDLFQASITAGTIRFPTYTTNGTLSFTGSNGTISSSSDRRLKQNEEELNPAASLEKIMNLQPKKFKWISTPDVEEIGFIAQDVETVIPEAIDGKKFAYEFFRDGATQDNEGVVRLDENGLPVMDENRPRYRGLNQCAILSTLVSAFQKSIEKINALEARINELDH